METQNNKEELRTKLRTLWLDRVMWTRMLLIGISEDLKGEEDNILKRLRQNQEDICEALKPYLEKYLFCWDDVPGNDDTKLLDFLFTSFGVKSATAESASITKFENGKNMRINTISTSIPIRLNDEKTMAVMVIDIGGKPHDFKFNAKTENGRLNIYLESTENVNVLSTILKSNIIISKNFIVAKKEKNTTKDLEAEEALQDTAVSIASLLSYLNPNLSHKQLETLMYEYIRLMKAEIIAHLNNNNTNSDLAVYDMLQKHAIKIADVLTDGIILRT